MTNMIFPCKMGQHPTPAVPVRDVNGARLSLDIIRAYVMVALDYVRKRPERTFQVQQDGWGYDRKQIAPMFDYCPKNIKLPYGFIY